MFLPGRRPARRSRAGRHARLKAYAEAQGIEAVVTEPKPRRANIRARGYGENFATDRKGAWTH